MVNRKLFIGISMLWFAACVPAPAATPDPAQIRTQISDAATLVATQVAMTVAAQNAQVTEQPTPIVPTDTPLPTQTETVPATPLPLPTATATVLIAGMHKVAPGETLSCIGRGYGVLPKAIADASGIELTSILHIGQILEIPFVQWVDIPPGPVCKAQFTPPFPGLPVTNPPTQPTLYIPVTPTPTCSILPKPCVTYQPP